MQNAVTSYQCGDFVFLHVDFEFVVLLLPDYLQKDLRRIWKANYAVTSPHRVGNSYLDRNYRVHNGRIWIFQKCSHSWMVLDFGKSEMVESCHVDVHYRKRLGDHVIYLHLQVLFVGHTADQTRGMFKKPRSLISWFSLSCPFHFLFTLLN